MQNLCSSCKRVLSQFFVSAKPSKGGPNPKYEHLRHAEDLVPSAVQCRLCDLILNNLQLVFDFKTPFGLANDQILSLEDYRHRPVLFELAGDDPFPCDSSVTGSRWTRLHVSVFFADSDDSGCTAYFYLFAHQDSVAFKRRDIIGKQGLVNSESDEALALLRSWYKCCLTTHTQCLQTFSGDREDPAQMPCLPTRVLDVGPVDSSQPLRLFRSDGFHAHYATLSHCWGPSTKDNFRTTKSNLEGHFQRIDLEHLSETYRDCIMVTKTIGLRYLWIDSLCIVQDDAEDWEAEAQRMGSYYELSSMTVAAAATEIDSGGLFRQFSVLEHAVEVPYIDLGGVEHGSFFVAPQPEGWGDVRRSALHQRAWFAQERLLSRRMIHYRDDALIWRCREVHHTDIGLSLSQPPLAIADWPLVINEYTGLGISFEQDRLIAIQGLANLLKQTRTDTYSFGMWTGDLPQQLFWTKSDTMIRNTALSHVPSWSWASKIGQIDAFWPRHTVHDWEQAADFVHIEDSGALTVAGYLVQAKGVQYRNLAQGWPDACPGVYEEPFGINWGLALDDFSLPDELPIGEITMLTRSGESDTVVGWIVLDLDDDVRHPLYFFLLATAEKSRSRICGTECDCQQALRHIGTRSGSSSSSSSSSSERNCDTAHSPDSSNDCATVEIALCQVLALQPSPSYPGAFERVGVGHVGDTMYQNFIDAGTQSIVLV